MKLASLVTEHCTGKITIEQVLISTCRSLSNPSLAALAAKRKYRQNSQQTEYYGTRNNWIKLSKDLFLDLNQILQIVELSCPKPAFHHPVYTYIASFQYFTNLIFHLTLRREYIQINYMNISLSSMQKEDFSKTNCG